MVKVLHINNAYSVSPLHKFLIENLSNKVDFQCIYVPIRNKLQTNNNKYVCDNVKYIYSFIPLHILRPFYFLKLFILFFDLIRKVRVYNFSVIHAHFLMSNGGVAWLLKKIFGIPYITAIRNTDINAFFKYQPYLKFFAKRILKEADKIIVISPSYKGHVKKSLSTKFYNQIENKIEIIPNGIEDIWFENSPKDKLIKRNQALNLLYIGNFTKSKNIETLIYAADMLKEKEDIVLHMIGCGGDNDSVIKQLIEKRSDYIRHYGKINKRKQIIDIMRLCDIFIMVSLQETFGLVYIEAMSQGLPIIYSQDQGVDGYFEEGAVGFSVDPKDPKDIIDKIVMIRDNYSGISTKALELSKVFNWDQVGNKYLHIYQEITNDEKK